jgi:NAD(P)-dependent dehydrogenase (short-subunit alcohol dehydrogenase family)
VGGRLEGKIALITGTGGGQGRAAAIKFAAEGATIVGADVKVEGNAETVQLVRDAGGTMTGMAPVDLGDPEQARRWVEDAVAEYGQIDVVYNNASGAQFGPIESFSIEQWQLGMRNEVDLVFYVCKYAWPYLTVRRGVIINTASVSGWIAGPGPDLLSHCAAKGAVLALTRALAVNGAPYGVRAVSISPGPIVSPGTAEMFAIPEVRDTIQASLLVDRLGDPTDIATVAAFLASDEASFVTGSDWRVDGGMTAT